MITEFAAMEVWKLWLLGCGSAFVIGSMLATVLIAFIIRTSGTRSEVEGWRD